MQIHEDYKSPNFDNRPLGADINYIITHFTEINFTETIERFLNPNAKVSAHYLIASSGKIYCLIQPKYRAWHAGPSKWRNKVAMNDYSIGIEMDNNGCEEFSKPQMKSCVELCLKLTQDWNIPKANILGHSDIAPHRKIDPGILFDWKHLLSHGLGIYFNDNMKTNKNQQNSYHLGQRSPKIFELQKKLRHIGYDVRITGCYDQSFCYIVRAFQLHFAPQMLQNKLVSIKDIDYQAHLWNDKLDNILEQIYQNSH